MNPLPAWETVPEGVRVYIKATAGASRNAISGLVEEPERQGSRCWLKVNVTAPPDGGKANQAIITLLAKSWRIPKSSIQILSGVTDRHKVLLLQTLSSELMDALKQWQPSVQSKL